MRNGKSKSVGSRQAGRAIALHRQGSLVRAVVVKSSGDVLTVERFQTLPYRGDADNGPILQLVAGAKPDFIVVVIGATQTAVRCIDVAAPPLDQPESAAAALSLIAEAHQPSTIEPHRRSAGRLNGASADLPGLVTVAWTGAAQPLGLPRVDAWVPEVVALSVLRSTVGLNTAGVGLFFDAGTGAMSLVGVGAGGRVLARVLREEPGDAVQAAAVAARDELAGVVGLEGGETAPVLVDGQTGCGLSLGGLATGKPLAVPGVPSAPDWPVQYGVALGAAAAAMESNPLIAGFLSMKAEAPVERRQPLLAVLNWLSRPARAAAVITLCVLAVLLAPMGVSYARLNILKARAEASTGSEAEFRKASEQADFYALLREKRWPMTKLLADLVSTAPAGIMLESVVLEHGKRVQVSGVTTSSDLVSSWRDALTNSVVFDDVKVPSVEGGSTPVRFQLNARVNQPLLALKGTAVTVTSADAPARPASGSERADRSDRSGRGRDTVRGNTPASGGGRNNNSAAAAARPAEAKPKEVKPPPAPISDAEIAALDRGSAMKEFVSRRAASQQPNLDAAVKERLAAEATKAQQRMQQLSGGGQ